MKGKMLISLDVDDDGGGGVGNGDDHGNDGLNIGITKYLKIGPSYCFLSYLLC
jgi:hypothetical protein